MSPDNMLSISCYPDVGSDQLCRRDLGNLKNEKETQGSDTQVAPNLSTIFQDAPPFIPTCQLDDRCFSGQRGDLW